jgi:hypothetical protein
MGPPAIPYLVRVLHGKDPTTRRGAVKALGRMGGQGKEGVDPLLKRIAREEVAVIRAEILAALKAIDGANPRVVQEFQKRLRDREPEVQDAARRALAPEPAPGDSGAAPGSAAKEGLELREAVTGRLGSPAFGMAAEVVREKRRAALIWPLRPLGETQGNELVALVFTQQAAGGWVPEGQPVNLAGGDAATRLAAALGGADKQRVVKPCGVAREQLSAHLKQWGCAFQAARKDGKDEEQARAYEELARAFSFPLVAYNDLLLKALEQGGTCSPEWVIDPACAAETCAFEHRMPDGSRGPTAGGQVVLQACGEGWVIAEVRQSPSPSPSPSP